MKNTYERYEDMVLALRVTQFGEIIPLHQAALGLAGEVSEVAELALCLPFTRDTIKELGDVCWYATAICLHHSWSVDYTARIGRLMLLPHNGLVLQLVVEAGAVCELVKKAEWHGKPYTVGAMHHRMVNIFALVSALSSHECSCLEDVLQTNMDKLAKRWPNGFGVIT